MLEFAVLGVGGLYMACELIKNFDRYLMQDKFYRVMKATGIKNKFETTYRALKVIRKQYGYDLLISLPDGLSYKKLEDKLPEIESGLRCVSEMEWKRFEGCAYLKIAKREYDSDKRFVPVETKDGCELYFGETYFGEKLKADMRDFPHVLVAGSTGTGKSRCLFIAITNLLYWHENVDLYLAQVSDKKDVQKFAYYKQTRYFAQNLQTTDQLIKYMLNLQKQRNGELNRHGMNNIGEYNKRFKDKQMNYAYLVIDEFASLMTGESKGVDPDYTIKKRIIFNLNELARQARSAGIFIISSLQRPDRVNLDPNMKNLFNIKVAFRANNIASSKVLTDDDSAFNLPNREALFIGSTQKTLKTPYIDDKLIGLTLLSRYEKNHRYDEIYPREVEKPTSDKVVSIEKPKKAKGVLKKC